jgi:signal transduction histidine kinase
VERELAEAETGGAFVKQVSLRAANMPSPTVADTRLSGTRLLIARSVWIGLMLLYCGFYLAALLVYYIQFHGNPVWGTGNQEGVYAHLISTPVVVNGYDALESSSTFFTGPYATLNITLFTLLMTPFWIAVGLLIFWRRSDDWMALFVSLFLVMLVTMFTPPLVALSYVVGFTSPLGICITLLQLLAMSSAGFFFVLFPDGRFVPGWTRWLTLAYLLLLVLLCLPSTSSYSMVRWPPVLLVPLFLGLGFAWSFAQLYRYRRVSTAIQRQQTKWIVFAILVSIFADFSNELQFVLPGSAHPVFIVLSEVTLPLFLLLIPCTIGFAVLRYQLWDIDVIINRTLVYGLLTLSVLGLYILVVVGLGTLFSALGNLFLSLLATGLVAVVFQPLRQRLQRAVNRLMYGERDEPYRVLSRLGSRLEATLATGDLMPTIVQTVAQALRLPYVAITYKQQDEDVLAASTGEAREQEALVRVPLVVQAEQVGDLVLAARAPGESLTPADLRLLHDLASQIAISVQAVRLTAELKQMTADLQQSRTQLITAREEERRRLRRDLHDGLGPQLSSQPLLLSSALMLLRQDPGEAEAILNSAITQSQEAIGDIRRLVYALRPPALDDLGLVAAIGELFTQYRASGIAFSLETSEQLPPLPAAVEVACYRIVQEALTNVMRHAHAHTCLVRLMCQEQVTVEIIDDGQGLSPTYRHGVGLTSMRERTEELGGTWLIEPAPAGGACVRAQIPYR